MSLFGFRASKEPPGRSHRTNDDLLRIKDDLARKVSHNLLGGGSESAAWGVSPIDKYFGSKPGPQVPDDD